MNPNCYFLGVDNNTAIDNADKLNVDFSDCDDFKREILSNIYIPSGNAIPINGFFQDYSLLSRITLLPFNRTSYAVLIWNNIFVCLDIYHTYLFILQQKPIGDHYILFNSSDTYSLMRFDELNNICINECPKMAFLSINNKDNLLQDLCFDIESKTGTQFYKTMILAGVAEIHHSVPPTLHRKLVLEHGLQVPEELLIMVLNCEIAG